MTSDFFTVVWDGAAQVVTSLAPAVELVLALAVAFWVAQVIVRLVTGVGRRGETDRPSDRR